MKLDTALRTKVVEGAIATLAKEYVYPDVATKIGKKLKENLAAKRYDNVNSPERFAKLLTEDLQALSKDKHLGVSFNAVPSSKPDWRPDAEPTREEKAAMRAHVATVNAGFVKVERLPGNIGYLRFDAFLSPSVAGSTAAAAMAFLANTDELIIDLRYNGGGSPEMVALMVSYLYDGDPPHQLSGIYWRLGDRTRQYWTLPQVAGPAYVDKPVYVLTSSRTFSAAEHFAHDVQMLKRAKLVGEVTGGGAHPGGGRRLTPNFEMGLPMGRSVHPVTNKNWEGTGVKPNVKADEAKALDVAYVAALRSQRKRVKSPSGFVGEIEKALAKAEAKVGTKKKQKR